MSHDLYRDVYLAIRTRTCATVSEAEDATDAVIARFIAESERLRDENKRLRELVKDLEEELKEIGAVAWRTPDEKAVDADLLREDAHERKRLEKEYPWKE